MKRYECKSCFASEKYSRVVEAFAKKRDITLDSALDFFYHSDVYRLMREGVSDMHCMSDEYLVEELDEELKGGYLKI